MFKRLGASVCLAQVVLGLLLRCVLAIGDK